MLRSFVAATIFVTTIFELLTINCQPYDCKVGESICLADNVTFLNSKGQPVPMINYKGKVQFVCVIENVKDAGDKYSLMLGNNVVATKDELDAGNWIVFTVEIVDATQFGYYRCKRDGATLVGESKKTFPLKYYLCDDASDVCQNSEPCMPPSDKVTVYKCAITDGGRGQPTCLQNIDCYYDVGDLFLKPCKSGGVGDMCSTSTAIWHMIFNYANAMRCLDVVQYVRISQKEVKGKEYYGLRYKVPAKIIVRCPSKLQYECRVLNEDKSLVKQNAGKCTALDQPFNLDETFLALQPTSDLFKSFELKCILSTVDPPKPKEVLHAETFYEFVYLSSQVQLNLTLGACHRELGVRTLVCSLNPNLPENPESLFRMLDVTFIRKNDGSFRTKGSVLPLGVSKAELNVTFYGDYVCTAIVRYKTCSIANVLLWNFTSNKLTLELSTDGCITEGTATYPIDTTTAEMVSLESGATKGGKKGDEPVMESWLIALISVIGFILLAAMIGGTVIGCVLCDNRRRKRREARRRAMESQSQSTAAGARVVQSQRSASVSRTPSSRKPSVSRSPTSRNANQKSRGEPRSRTRSNVRPSSTRHRQKNRR